MKGYPAQAIPFPKIIGMHELLPRQELPAKGIFPGVLLQPMGRCGRGLNSGKQSRNLDIYYMKWHRYAKIAIRSEHAGHFPGAWESPNAPVQGGRPDHFVRQQKGRDGVLYFYVWLR